MHEAPSARDSFKCHPCWELRLVRLPTTLRTVPPASSDFLQCNIHCTVLSLLTEVSAFISREGGLDVRRCVFLGPQVPPTAASGVH